MKLESRKVYLDAQSYIRLGLNFDHPALKALRELCSRRLLQLQITSVVEREVRAHIDEEIDEAIAALKKFQRKARLLEKLEDPELAGFFGLVGKDETKEKAQAVFTDFLTSCNATVLGAEALNVESVLDAYFNRRSPFGVDKKKNEFPDAISLGVLLESLGSEKIYVVSEDKDLKSASEHQDEFIQVDTLDQFLDVYNRHESALTDLVLKEVERHMDHIESELLASVESLGVYNSAPWEDSEVVDFEIHQLSDFVPSVVYVDDQEAIVTLDFNAAYSVTVTGPDYLNGTYDSEDKRIYAFGDTTNTCEDTQQLSAEVAFYYAVDEGELKDLEREEARLIDLQDIEVYVNEYDEGWQ